MADYSSFPVDTAAASSDSVLIEKSVGNRTFKTRQTPSNLVVSDGSTSNPLSTWAAAVTANTGVLAGGSPLFTAKRTFTETAGSGVYTGSVSLPAGATVVEVIVDGIALWTNAGTATMTVGDAGNASGFFASVNLKATDLLAGESISFDEAGGKAGAYIANSQVSPRYSASTRVISGVVTTSSTGGGAGVTHMTVLWSLPGAAFITAATKV